MGGIGRSTYTRMDVLKHFYKLQGGEKIAGIYEVSPSL